MLITKEDVGRKVRLRNDSVVTIVAFNDRVPFPVILDNENALTEEGAHWRNLGDSEEDIIEFIEEGSNTKIDHNLNGVGDICNISQAIESGRSFKLLFTDRYIIVDEYGNLEYVDDGTLVTLNKNLLTAQFELEPYKVTVDNTEVENALKKMLEDSKCEIPPCYVNQFKKDIGLL